MDNKNLHLLPVSHNTETFEKASSEILFMHINKPSGETL